MHSSSMVRLFQSQGRHRKIVHYFIFRQRLVLFPSLVDHLLKCAVFSPLVHNIDLLFQQIERLNRLDKR
jgi:hypothetical protein